METREDIYLQTLPNRNKYTKLGLKCFISYSLKAFVIQMAIGRHFLQRVKHATRQPMQTPPRAMAASFTTSDQRDKVYALVATTCDM
jgi:hypothetical protein